MAPSKCSLANDTTRVRELSSEEDRMRLPTVAQGTQRLYDTLRYVSKYVVVRWYWKDPFTLRLEQPGWKEFSLDNTAKLEEAYQSFHATGQKEVRVPVHNAR